MPRFFRRLAEGIFDLEDLTRRTHELADFVTAAAQHYKRDAGEIVAVGYSNGANIAASVLLLRPATLRGAILFRAMVPIVPDPLPNLSAASVFISAGNQDRIIEPSETEKLARLLRECGADVTIRFVDSGHGLTASDLEAAHLWLEAEHANESVRQA